MKPSAAGACAVLLGLTAGGCIPRASSAVCCLGTVNPVQLRSSRMLLTVPVDQARPAGVPLLKLGDEAIDIFGQFLGLPVGGRPVRATLCSMDFRPANDPRRGFSSRGHGACVRFVPTVARTNVDQPGELELAFLHEVAHSFHQEGQEAHNSLFEPLGLRSVLGESATQPVKLRSDR